jgi:hypothetical protein
MRSRVAGGIAVVVAIAGALAGTTTAGAQVENQAPDCAAAVPSVTELWPPNHKLREVSVGGVADPDGDPVTLTITAIAQDEPVDGSGDGSTCPDGLGVGTPSARLRAERSGGGDGRVYEVRFSADDGMGGSCDGAFVVCVPHDRGRGAACGDPGPLVDSTGGLPETCEGEDCGPEDCAPEPEDLAPAPCAGAELPRGVAKRVARANDLLARAGTSPSARRTERLAERAGRLFRRAATRAGRAESLAPGCAAALHETLDDAGTCATCLAAGD